MLKKVVNVIKPIFTFGVIADVQYGDFDDAYNFSQTSLRRYRNAFVVFQQGIEEWNKYNNNEHNKQLSFIANFGDFIDGKCSSNETQEESINKLLDEYNNNYNGKNKDLLSTIGNHELYNFSRDELYKKLNFDKFETNDENNDNFVPKLYYDYKPKIINDENEFIDVDGWRIIVLNTFEFSTLWKGEDDEEAFNYLDDNNPNDLKTCVDWLEGVEGVEKRFVPYNGGIKEEQQTWLKNTLEDCKNNNEKAFIFAHSPICPGSCVDDCLLWNYDQILDILHDYSSTVVAYIAGHDHAGGYMIDESNIAHITLASPLECLNDKTAFGIIEVFDDSFRLNGFNGNVPTETFQF